MMFQCRSFQKDGVIVWMVTDSQFLEIFVPKVGQHPHVEGHGHCTTISQMHTLIPAEKQVMEPIVLPNLEALGIVNHFLILFGFSCCDQFNGTRKMKMLCIATSKKGCFSMGLLIVLTSKKATMLRSLK